MNGFDNYILNLSQSVFYVNVLKTGINKLFCCYLFFLFLHIVIVMFDRCECVSKCSLLQSNIVSA